MIKRGMNIFLSQTPNNDVHLIFLGQDSAVAGSCIILWLDQDMRLLNEGNHLHHRIGERLLTLWPFHDIRAGFSIWNTQHRQHPPKTVCSLAAQKGTWQWRDAVHVKRDWVFHRLQKGFPEHSIANPVPLELEPFSWFREGSELSNNLKIEDVNGWCQAVHCPSAADLHFLIIKRLVKKYPKLTSTSDDVKKKTRNKKYEHANKYRKNPMVLSNGHGHAMLHFHLSFYSCSM